MPEIDRMEFRATVDDQGRLHPESAGVIRARLARRFRKKSILVTITAWRKPKTLPQLGYYYDVVVPAWAEHCGYAEDEMHIELKRAFLSPIISIARLTGEEREEIPSLSDLSSQEMSEYLDRLLLESDRLGLNIPRPNQRFDLTL